MIIRFAGFGGQGIILSSFILGEAAVTEGLQAIQNQAYGSESRGGECRGDIIISDSTIHELEPTRYDVLVALTQPAYEKFLPRLRPGGTLILEKDMVEGKPELEPAGITRYSIAATDIAIKQFGNRIMANMAILGFLNTLLKIVPHEALAGAIVRNVPKGTGEANLGAMEEGARLAREWSSG